LAEKVHNLGADDLRIALSNTAPDATDTTLADVAEITPANGYAAGGNAASITSSSQTSGTYKLVLGDVTFTASGGAINTFRYAILYNNTATNNEVIGWWDSGAAQNITDGNSFIVDFDAGTGVLTIA
jgi:hypothetical protein